MSRHIVEAVTKPLRALIVEDSEDDALLLIRNLRRGGFSPLCQRVDSATDLERALEDGPWDIVITDHNMPDFSSTEALALVRGQGLDVPVIIVSGSIGEEIAVEAMKSGANDYIMKGSLTRLVPAIERELREAEERRSHRHAQEIIRHLAFHDTLTGLVNRHEFESRLQAAVDSARVENKYHALLYVDLDQFKIVNDTCGHIAGDQLLKRLSAVLHQAVRETDTVARLGGDEFGVLLENCPVENATTVANALLRAVQSFRFVWENRSFTIGASVGIAEITPRSASVSEILCNADLACYAAKERGRNRIHIYVDSDKDMARRRGEMQWVGRIHEALDANWFQLYRQCIAPLQDRGLPPHCEVLLRMREPDGNIIPPSMFIPSAERYNLMQKIDRWVVRKVVQHIRREGQQSHRGRLFVNLSGESISDHDFIGFLEAEIRDNHISPHAIGFEITETSAIADFAAATTFIERVRGVGCAVALDDFGSGMSSFGYLKSIDVDYIKIDGGFVRNMLDDAMDCAIVESINRIGHVAKMKTVAEFVESDALKERLRGLGVDYAQGYGIDLPGPLASP